MSKLYAATIAIGKTKKTASQASGSPSRLGVVRSSRARLAIIPPGEASSGGLHLFPDLGVDRPPRDVAVEVGVRQCDGLRGGQIQRPQQVARSGPRHRVRVPVAVVVLQPLRRLRRAPGV